MEKDFTIFKKTASLFTISRTDSDVFRQKLTSSRCCRNYFIQLFKDDLEIYESFFVAFLNRANNTIGHAKISQGGITGTVVDVRMIAKLAVDTLATAIVICHNHPSGNLMPSKADTQLTEKIKHALGLFDITLLDHIILTTDSYYSFADDGLL